MAEEERFELSVLVSKYGHLANAWFQPLTHSSTVIKGYIRLAKNSKQFYNLADKYKHEIQYLMKNNSKAYKQLKKVADAKELELNNVQQ